MKKFCQNCSSDEVLSLTLKSAGLSTTAPRLNLCRYILCEAKHPTAEDVKNWVVKNGLKISLATIYNTLHSLCKAKLLKDLRFPHMDKVIYDNNVSRHHHFLDEETGELIDIPLDEIDINPNLNRKYEIEKIDILVRGRLTK